MTEQLAKELAAEMDFEVMAKIMIDSGWHKVKLERFKNNNHAIDVLYWTEAHSKFNFIQRSTTYVFEDEGDAVNFALKWI